MRWTDLAEWVGPTPNCGDGDQYPNEGDDAMREQRGLVIHIAEGYYSGTIAWQKNPDVNVSSHFIVAGPRDTARWGTPDGKIAQIVDTDIAAWTQRDGNGHWLSVEFSGFAGDTLSAAQIEACAKIFARGHHEYGYPLQIATAPSGRGLGHHSMGAEAGADWGHPDCPGEPIKAQKPIILARAKVIAQGGPNGGDDMPRFVRESETGKVFACDGPLRWWVRSSAGLDAALAVFGQTRDDIKIVPHAHIEGAFGLDVSDGLPAAPVGAPVNLTAEAVAAVAVATSREEGRRLSAA